nr:MAG TPA: hypothetical protein [Caudoviricetes sp.]
MYFLLYFFINVTRSYDTTDDKILFSNTYDRSITSLYLRNIAAPLFNLLLFDKLWSKRFCNLFIRFSFRLCFDSCSFRFTFSLDLLLLCFDCSLFFFLFCSNKSHFFIFIGLYLSCLCFDICQLKFLLCSYFSLDRCRRLRIRYNIGKINSVNNNTIWLKFLFQIYIKSFI